MHRLLPLAIALFLGGASIPVHSPPPFHAPPPPLPQTQIVTWTVYRIPATPPPPQPNYPALDPSASNVISPIVSISTAYSIPPPFVLAISYVESRWQAGEVSVGGAIGPLQVTPIAAQQAAIPLTSLRNDISAGVSYIRWLDQYLAAPASCLAKPSHATVCDDLISDYYAGPTGAYQPVYVCEVLAAWGDIDAAIRNGVEPVSIALPGNCA